MSGSSSKKRGVVSSRFPLVVPFEEDAGRAVEDEVGAWVGAMVVEEGRGAGSSSSESEDAKNRAGSRAPAVFTISASCPMLDIAPR